MKEAALENQNIYGKTSKIVMIFSDTSMKSVILAKSKTIVSGTSTRRAGSTLPIERRKT
jgi:hypothetical protein